MLILPETKIIELTQEYCDKCVLRSLRFAEKYRKESVSRKKSLFLKDSGYSELYGYYVQAVNAGLERKKNGTILSEEEFQRIKKGLSDAESKVREFNQVKAKFKRADAMLDLNYASEKSDKMSLQLARRK